MINASFSLSFPCQIVSCKDKFLGSCKTNLQLFNKFLIYLLPKSSFHFSRQRLDLPHKHQMKDEAQISRLCRRSSFVVSLRNRKTINKYLAVNGITFRWKNNTETDVSERKVINFCAPLCCEKFFISTDFSFMFVQKHSKSTFCFAKLCLQLDN